MSALDKKVKNYWAGRDKNAVNGLVLLDSCIKELADNRNWDPLSRFLSSSETSGQGLKVKRIIRLAFGDNLKWKRDMNHATGGKFTLGWEGQFNIAGNNAYVSNVGKAIEERTGWDSAAFSKELGKLLPSPVKKKVEVDEAKTKARAKTIADTLKRMEADGYNVAEILRFAQADLANRVKVVN